jgi:hypothetical protein
MRYISGRLDNNQVSQSVTVKDRSQEKPVVVQRDQIRIELKIYCELF